MEIRGQWWFVGALPLCALVLGAVDRHPERMVDMDSLFSTCIATVCVLLVFCWYRIDAKARGYGTSWGMSIAMILITVVALPWYLIRSRKGGRSALALTAALGVFVLCCLAYRLSSTVGVPA
jgi:hypothetical protein